MRINKFRALDWNEYKINGGYCATSHVEILPGISIKFIISGGPKVEYVVTYIGPNKYMETIPCVKLSNAKKIAQSLFNSLCQDIMLSVSQA